VPLPCEVEQQQQQQQQQQQRRSVGVSADMYRNQRTGKKAQRETGERAEGEDGGC
jgi:hypothetical protein